VRPARGRRLRACAFGLALAAVLVLAFGASLLSFTGAGSEQPAGGRDSFGEISAAALGGAQRMLKAHEGERVLDAAPPPAAEVVEVATRSLETAPAPARAVLSVPPPVPSLRL
jgi:hypothetical protein